MLNFYALKEGMAGKVAAIDRLSLVFVIVLAAMFLGERLTWQTSLGAIIMAFAKISPPAGGPAVHPVRTFLVSNGAWLLLIPYLLWVSFAAYLNYSIWILNF